MDNTDLGGKPSPIVAGSAEDIPAALREGSSQVPARRWRRVWLVAGLMGLGAMALFAGFLFATLSDPGSKGVTAKNNKNTPSESTPTTRSSVDSAKTEPDIVLGKSGHFAYKEAPPQDLQSITADGRMKLRKAAAQKFQQMAAAARAQGIILVPISGFRSVSEQQYLFFDVKAQRGQGAAERASVSAPPGYSEHHTGYAMDIGDGNVPATNLSPNFEKTAAFKWLQANAARFSFEMSFPKNNSQGVSYEPWHWRFVGDRQSLETFYKAKRLNPASGAPQTGR